MNRPVLAGNQRDGWHRDGWCLVDGLFTTDELVAAQDEVGRLFPTGKASAADTGRDGEGRRRANDRRKADATEPLFPFDGPALNRLVVHDALIDLAEDLLGTGEVRLYQGMATAKHSGGGDHDEQLLHVDYGNHTLVVPRADLGFQHLELFVYLSDVTPETAATRMVSRTLTGHIPVERTYLHLEEYASLYRAEVPASGPAGSVLAYRPDVYHRGTSLSAAAATRFLLHVAYKPVRTDWLGFHAFPGHAEREAWHRFVGQATARQLTVLGFPPPGHPYWNAETLTGVAARYPHLDMTPWRRQQPTGNNPPERNHPK